MFEMVTMMVVTMMVMLVMVMTMMAAVMAATACEAARRRKISNAHYRNRGQTLAESLHRTSPEN
jgi:hypothetical protein